MTTGHNRPGAKRRRKQRARSPKSRRQRRLYLETLEDRRLLTLWTVTDLDSDAIVADGKVTLREAVMAARNDAQFGDAVPGSSTGPDEIRFAKELFQSGPRTLTIGSPLPLFGGDSTRANAASLTIVGPGMDLLTIDGTNSSTNVFTVTGIVAVSGLEIINANGAAIDVQGTDTNFTIRDSRLTGNNSSAIVSNATNTVTVGNSVLTDNRDSAIKITDGFLNVYDAEITGNRTTGEGGGIFRALTAGAGNVTVLRSNISHNHADGNGGGIASYSFTDIHEVTMQGNTSGGSGGAVWLRSVGMTVSDSLIAGNHAAEEGGGIAIGGVDFVNDISRTQLRNLSIRDNVAGDGGGGISIEGAEVRISGTEVSGNVSRNNGGGIAARKRVPDNPATATTSARTSIVNSTISGNYAGNDGGGIFHSGETDLAPDAFLDLTNVTLVLNRSDADASGSGLGGGLAIDDTPGEKALAAPSAKLINTIIAGNVAGQTGVEVVDNEDTEGFEISGNWPVGGNFFAHRDNYLINSPGAGADRATWTFTELVPGRYRILANWAANTDRATNAPYTIKDGTRRLGTVLVDQTRAALPHVVESSANFQELGQYSVLSRSLTIELTDDADGNVVADAIRLERIDDGSPASDIRVLSAAPHNTINAAASVHNLIGDPATAGGLTGAPASNANQIGDPFGESWNINRILSTNLADNLGRRPVRHEQTFGTMTRTLVVPAPAIHPLKVDSPAIDAGTTLAPVGPDGRRLYTDQRGYPFVRQDTPFAASAASTSPVDIGAYEVQIRPTFTEEEILVTILGDESNGDLSLDDISLREAVEIANMSPDHNAIRFSPDLIDPLAVGGTHITLTEPLEIKWETTISGPGADFLTMGGIGSGYIFVGDQADLLLSGLRLSGFADTSQALLNEGRTTIVDSVFEHNTTVAGVIRNIGTLKIRDSRLSNNTDRAIYNFPLRSVDNNTRFIRVGEGIVELGPNVLITHNRATNAGGSAIFSRHGIVTIADSTISDNVAVVSAGAGGGIISLDSALEIRRSTIARNVAEAGDAGGIFSERGSLRIFDTTIEGNVANSTRANMAVKGGGVYVSTGAGGILEIDRSTFSNNRVLGFAGSTVNGAEGGGAYVNSKGAERSLVRSSTFSGNRADGFGARGQGGGFYHASDFAANPFVFESNTLADNIANTGGGAYLFTPLARLSNSIFSDNQSSAGDEPNLVIQGGEIGNLRNNLVQSVTATSGSVQFQFENNMDGNFIVAAGAGLQGEGLQDNGGRTLTHKLAPDSLAIDTGQRDGLLDQRGFPITDNDRSAITFPSGITETPSNADIGAYESEEVVLQRFQAQIRDASQFGPGSATVIGEGFDLGRPLCEDVGASVACTTVPKEPGFLGLEFDPAPFTLGPGVAEGFFGDKWGGQARADLDGRVGFEYGYYVNSGSVDTFYDGLFGYGVDDSNPNSIVINTSATITDGSMFTMSPRVGAYVDLVFEFKAAISGEACVIWCAGGNFAINIDKTTPLFSINRQKQDDNGNAQFLTGIPDDSATDADEGLTTDSRGGLNPPAFDGAIKIAGIELDNLISGGIAVVDTVRSLANYLPQQREMRRQAEIDKAAGIGSPAAHDATIRQTMDNEKRATSKKPGSSNSKAGEFITVGLGETDGELLGLELELGVGFSAGKVGVGKKLGKITATLPEIQLSDTEIDEQGKLSATTDDFVFGSTQDKNRQLVAMSVDVAAIGPLGTYTVDLGPIGLEATTVSYNITPRLAISQDASVVPFFDEDHQATFVFNGFSGSIDVTVGDTVHSGITAGGSVSFMPGQTVIVNSGGQAVDISPSIKVGNRFTNDIGMDIDVRGMLEVLKLKLNAFSQEIFQVGPLIEDEHSILDPVDLGSIFNQTWNLPATETILEPFRIGSDDASMPGNGSSPGAAFVLESGVPRPYSPPAADTEAYFSIPLVGSDGSARTDVRFKTEPTGTQVSRVRPPHSGMTLELLNGDTVVTAFEADIAGVDLTDPQLTSGWDGQIWRLSGFETLMGGRAIFGVSFNSANALDVTATAEGGEELTDVGVDTERLMTSATRRAGQLEMNAMVIDNDFAFDIDNDGVISVTTDGTLVGRFIESLQPGGAAFSIEGAVCKPSGPQTCQVAGEADGDRRVDEKEILAYLRGLQAAPDDLRYNGAAPFTGSFIPEQSLSAFDGQNAAGVWTLTVEDTANLDGGSINRWSLDIDDSREVGGVTNYASSNVPVTISSSGTPTVTSTITVPDSVTIMDVNVNLDIAHTWDSDLRISLTSPTGTVVNLSRNNGGAEDNYTDTTFDDEATTRIAGASEAEVLAYRAGLKDGQRLDVDGDGHITFDIDGQLILRHMSGLGTSITSAPNLTDDIMLGANAKRTLPEDIRDFIAGRRGPQARPAVDDQNPDAGDQTRSRSTRGDAALFAILDTAVAGSSPWNPIETGFENGRGTYPLATYGRATNFDSVYIVGDSDLLVRTGSQGTPGRSFEPDEHLQSYLQDPLSPDIRAFESRIDTDTRTLATDADAPIFVKLPDAAAYELTLPAGYTFTRLDIDSAVGGSAFLDHDGDAPDFDIYLPHMDQWLQVAMDTPFDLPAGANTIRLYPRDLNSPDLHAAENKDELDLDPIIGFVIAGPASPAPELDVTVLTDRQDTIEIDEIFADRDSISRFFQDEFPGEAVSQLLTLTNADLDDAREIVFDYLVTRRDDNPGDAWFGIGINPSDTTDSSRVVTRSDIGWLARTSFKDPTAHQLFDDGNLTDDAPSTLLSTTTHVTATISLPPAGIQAGQIATINIAYDDGNDGSVDSALNHEFSIDSDQLDIWLANRGQLNAYSLDVSLVTYDPNAAAEFRLKRDGAFVDLSVDGVAASLASDEGLSFAADALAQPPRLIDDDQDATNADFEIVSGTWQTAISNPIVHYRFEDLSGTVALDSAGGDNNGDYRNGIGRVVNSFNDGENNLGRAAVFDGVNDFIAATVTAEELGGDSYSFSLWVKSNVDGTTQSLFSLTGNNGHAALIELESNGQFRFLNRIPTGVSGGENLRGHSYVKDRWYHIVAVRDGLSMRLYVDGNEIGERQASGQIDFPTNITIGRLSPSSAARYFDGEMDDVAIFNRALTESEVQELFRSATGGFDADYLHSEDGTVRWTFPNLKPGNYRVYATWPESANRTTNARFFINDRNGPLSSFVTLNQRSAPAASYVEDGVPFQILTDFEVADDLLTVELSNSGSGLMAADAVRIERLDLLSLTTSIEESKFVDGPRLRVDVPRSELGSNTVTMNIAGSDGTPVTDTFRVTVVDVLPTSSVLAPIADLTLPLGTTQHTVDLSKIFFDDGVSFSTVSDNPLVTTSLAGDQLTLSISQNADAIITVSGHAAGDLVGTDTFALTVGDVETGRPKIIKPIPDQFVLQTVVIAGVKQIRITDNDSSGFYLEEVNIYNTSGVDVASTNFGSTGTPNFTPGFGSDADGAIDDQIGVCCTTGTHGNEMAVNPPDNYVITLPSPQNIDAVSFPIEIHNRTDGCCPQRTENFDIEFLDSSGRPILVDDGLGNAATVFSVQPHDFVTDYPYGGGTLEIDGFATIAVPLELSGRYTDRTEFTLASLTARNSNIFPDAQIKPIQVLGQNGVADTLILDGTGGPLYQPLLFRGNSLAGIAPGDAGDLIRVLGDGISLDTTEGDRIHNVGVIDLRGDGSNRLVVDPASVTNNERGSGFNPRLLVLADADDTVVREGSWTFINTQNAAQLPYNVYRSSEAAVGDVELWVSVAADTPPAAPYPGPSSPARTPSALTRSFVNAADLPAQVVMIPPDSPLVGIGETFNLDVGYNVADLRPGTPPSVLIEVHYDNDYLAFNGRVGFDDVATGGSGFIPSPVGTLEDTEAVPDGDLRTGRVVVLSWSDLVGTWPAGTPVETILASLEFQAQGKPGKTHLRITGLSSAGYRFDTKSLEIDIRHLIEVNSRLDTAADDGICTLREAIQAANTDSASGQMNGECAAGVGDDSIVFADGLMGVIELQNGTLPQLVASVDIIGPGADRLAIDGLNTWQILNIDGGGTETFKISGLTLKNGFRNGGDGGAMFVDNATLELTDLVVTDNRATKRAGGIRLLQSDATIRHSTFHNNETTNDWGGAIHSSGSTVRIEDSTFSDNAATGSFRNGGAIVNENFGRDGVMTIVNSTFSNNFANNKGGAIFNDFGGELTVYSSTITGNRAPLGGGIARDSGTVWLFNTIVAGNFASDGVTPHDVFGNLAGSSSFNLIGDTATAGGLTDGGNGNIVGVAVAEVLDPVLRDNGGPTLTHALITDSPAINTGDPAGVSLPLFDQRGTPFFRISDRRLDIGALESPSLIAAPWQNALDPFDVSGTNGVTALDVLLTVNYINNYGIGMLPPVSTNSPPPYVDVNGDGLVTPLDVALVVNQLNEQSLASVAGEGESDGPHGETVSWSFAIDEGPQRSPLLPSQIASRQNARTAAKPAKSAIADRQDRGPLDDQSVVQQTCQSSARRHDEVDQEFHHIDLLDDQLMDVLAIDVLSRRPAER